MPVYAGPYDIAIVGAGRVGQTLGRLWSALGHRLAFVACRSQAAAGEAVRFIGAGIPTTYAEAPLSMLSAPSGVVCFTTPDHAIAPTAALVAERRPAWPGVTALHCSGALSSAALHVLRPAGVHVASMHPLYAFGTAVADPALLHGVYWCLEGDDAALAVAQHLITALHGQSSIIAPAAKILYHAAAAVAGNQITGLMSVAFGILEHCGIAPEQARAMLIRLSEGALQRIKAEGEIVALAGPISRGDIATVAQHVEHLRALPPLYGDVYRSLSQVLVTLAQRKGTPETALEALRRLLQP